MQSPLHDAQAPPRESAHDRLPAPNERDDRRSATRPTEITMQGWRDVLSRLRRALADDEVGLVAAGVAFYLFLALFPALAAFLSVVGLVVDPAEVQRWVAGMRTIPGDVRDLVIEQAELHAEAGEQRLGWTFAITVLLAIWSASKGMRALMKAMNIAYGEGEGRGFVRLTFAALTFTGAAIVLAVLALAAIVGIPALFGHLGLGFAQQASAAAGSWVVLILAFLVALATLYRWGPHRSSAQWRWISPGALVALVVWIAASSLFSLYVGTFGSYSKSYGALAGVVVVLLWLWISALAVLLGAELNAEIEHQTRHDTTESDEPQPMGERGAHVADTVPET